MDKEMDPRTKRLWKAIFNEDSSLDEPYDNDEKSKCISKTKL